jgi:hypothetical protein
MSMCAALHKLNDRCVVERYRHRLRRILIFRLKVTSWKNILYEPQSFLVKKNSIKPEIVLLYK